MHRFLSPQRRPWLPFLILLALSALVVVFSPPRTERPSRRAEDVLRIGAPEPVRQATVISPYGPGVEFELFSRFNREAPCTPEWVNVANREQGFAMLRRGEIDLLVGFWGDEPGGDDAGSLSGGRAYAHFTPVSITGAAARPPAEASGVLKDLERTFSSFIPAFSASGQSGPSGEPSGDPSGVPPGERPPFPVFSPLTDGEGYPEKDGILMDPASSALWLPFMGDVDIKQASGQTPYRWFWRADGSALAQRLEAFWQHEDRQAELAELTERYFGFLPRTLRQTDILELADTLAQRLPEYETFIMNAAKETGVPPLLLVAAIYQESRFNPEAVSETQVRGIMQLTTATARMLEVDRKKPEECILGGARYLRDLFDRVGDKAANDWDRWFMALAAYNQGMSNLNRAIRMAQDAGGKGNTWSELKRTFPLSTTCRGVEARSFVEKIRYYHFILHGLVALAPLKTQDFAPLHSLALSERSF